MAELCWLHLSDWHQKGPDFNRQVVRDRLITDIRNRIQIDNRLARVDFIVFSGDVTFSGQEAEYNAAKVHFFDKVLEATDLSTNPDRLFIVPGNHDLNRQHVHDMLPPELQRPLDSDALVQKWFGLDTEKRTRTLEPFKAYRQFVSEYTGQPTPDYASIVRLNVSSIQVVLLGLNSAWMCGRKDERGDVINDYGHALVGEPQVHEALEQIVNADDVCIAVLHHPFEWLAEFDRYSIKARLKRKCHFILSGHEHCPQVEVAHGTLGNCVTIPAGACFKGRIAENPRNTNSYNFVYLDFDSRQSVVYLRRWSEPRNAWIQDNDSCPTGNYSFPFLGKD